MAKRALIFVAVLAGGYLTLAVALRYPVVVVLLLALALTIRRELRASGRRRNRAGYVYVMTNGGGRGVKIGRAKNPEQRLKAHRTTAPRARYLKLWRVKDAPAAEARLTVNNPRLKPGACRSRFRPQGERRRGATTDDIGQYSGLCALYPVAVGPVDTAGKAGAQALGGLFAVCRFAHAPKRTSLFAYRFFACQTQRSARFASYFSTFVPLAQGVSDD